MSEIRREDRGFGDAGVCADSDAVVVLRLQGDSDRHVRVTCAFPTDSGNFNGGGQRHAKFRQIHHAGGSDV